MGARMHFPATERVRLTQDGRDLVMWQITQAVEDGVAEKFDTHAPLFRRLEEAATREYMRHDPADVVSVRIRGDERGVDYATVRVSLDCFIHTISVG